MNEERTFNANKFLIISTTFAAFGFLVMIFFVPVPNAAENVLYTLIGGIVQKWASVLDYFFGSSSGSKAKSDVINEMTGTGDGTGSGKTKTSTTTKTEITKTASTETPAPTDPAAAPNEGEPSL